MSSAKKTKFKTFDDFFTRDFHENARPIATKGIIHPVDAKVVEQGMLAEHNELLIKHKKYLLSDFELQEPSIIAKFSFISYYLAPSNHHQVYMPASGKIIECTYVPGTLCSVKPNSDNSKQIVNSLNERLIISMQTEEGPIILIMVGALLVGSISTAWGKRFTPSNSEHIIHEKVNRNYSKGESIARFHYGSSVILITNNQLQTLNINPKSLCKMGEALWK